MAKSTRMLLIFVCIVLLQFLETSADDYIILLTYNTDVNNKTAQNHFNKLANTCKMLQNKSFSFKTFPTLENGIALEGLRKLSGSLPNVVGVLGAENYFLRLLDSTPNTTCNGAQLNASTLDVSMTGMLEVGVAYLNFLRSLQNTVDAVRITQSESTIIALPKYFTTVGNPFEVAQILDGAANLETPMNVFWYTRPSDSELLGKIIAQQQPTNVIALLNTEEINGLLNYAYKYDLLDWRRRWILMSPYGDLPNLPTNLKVINANVTVIGLGRGDSAELESLSGADKLAVDAADIAFTYLKEKNCFTCTPINEYRILIGRYQDANGYNNESNRILRRTGSGVWGRREVNAPVSPPKNITGTFDLSSPQVSRLSTVYSIYHNLGAEQKYSASVVVPTGQTPNISVSPVYAYNGTKEVVLTVLRTRPLRIVAALATPFVMINNGKLQIDALPKKADLSDLTGLSVDIMKKIVDTDNISYTLTVYAVVATDLLNLLKTGEADIAIGNYAVLPQLTTSFDFLSNYLYFTYSVLEEPSRALPVGASLFDFFGPLTDGFWVLIFFSAVIVALAMATLNYFSPNNLDFGFMESIFVAFGCLFQGLSVPPPNQWSSRILLSVWWMFSLFFVIIYATNYGALKTQSGMSRVVSGFDKLLVDPTVPFGPIANSTASLQLQSSGTLKIQQLMYLSTRLYGDKAQSRLEDAVDLVDKGQYRLIGDRFTLQYFARLKCLSVSGEYGTEQYAIVLQKNSVYQEYFQSIIYDLINNGEMKKILDSYTLDNTASCPASKPKGDVTLQFVNTIDSIGGIFIFLAIGIVIALMLAIIECVFWRKIAPFADRAARTNVGARLRNFC